MFKPAVTVTSKVIGKFDGIENILKALGEIKKNDVFVGIPQEKNSRQGAGITNAELGWLHSHGFRAPKWAVLRAYQNRKVRKQSKEAISALEAYIHSKGNPYWNVPARPFLEPAIEANKEAIASQQAKIIKAALDGKVDSIQTLQAQLGVMVQNFVKGWFTDPRNEWAPNNPLIVDLKGSDKPLIDSGQLRNSITFVIRPSGNA